MEIRNIEEFKETRFGLDFPVIVRDDWGHASEFALKRKQVILCTTEQELRDANLRAYKRPIAIEYIDTKSPDGIFRKYRYYAIGDLGFPHHIHMKRHWWVKGEEGGRLEHSDAIKEEELAWCVENIANLQTVDIGDGIHFIQESHPELIGKELSKWHAALE